MKKGSEVKVSHKVPQFSLRNFAIPKDNKADEYFVWTFNKNGERSHQSSVEKSCGEGKFYEPLLDKDLSKTLLNQDIQDDEKIILKGHEEAFSNIESNTAPIIRKIIEERTIANLTFDEKQQVAVFIACQVLRTDGYKQHLQTAPNKEKTLLEALSKRHNSPLENHQQYQELKALTENKEGQKFLHVSAINSASLYSLASKLMDKDWILFETNDDIPFIIGDNPAIYHDWIKTIFSEPKEFYLPISTNFTLGFWCKSINKDWKDTEEKISIIKQALHSNYKNIPQNERTSYNYAIEEYEKVQKLSGIKNISINLIDEEKTAVLSGDKVKEFNHWQLDRAYRFVYSNKDNIAEILPK